MKIKKAYKSFYKKDNKIVILDNIDFEFELGKLYMIIGESGAGKSTLINILGLLDKLDKGTIIYDEEITPNLSDKELANIRLKEIGLIFQDYYLNPRLTAKENILIATLINKDIKTKNRDNLINKILEYFHLQKRANHYPDELSGGERQRVCIARAIINNPNYILADEPTGSLDPENSQKVMDILLDLTKKGKCVIMVTHDYSNIKYADYVCSLANGKLKKENKDDFFKKYN